MLKVFNKGLVIKSKLDKKQYVVLGIDKELFLEQSVMVNFSNTKDDLDAMLNTYLIGCYSIIPKEKMTTAYPFSLLSKDEKILLLFNFDIITTIDVDLYNVKSNLVSGKNIQFISNEEAEQLYLERRKSSNTKRIFSKNFKETKLGIEGEGYCFKKGTFYYLVDVVKQNNEFYYVCYYKTRSKKDFLFHSFAIELFFSTLYITGIDLSQQTINSGTLYEVKYDTNI